MNETPKKIPIFAEPEIEPMMICGLECRVRRLNAVEAPHVITMLLSDFGSIIAEYLCTTVPQDLIKQAIGMKNAGEDPEEASDEPTPEDVEEFTRQSGFGIIKTIVASQAFERLAQRFKGGEVINLDYFMKALIIGKLSVDGVEIETSKELAATKIGPMNLMRLLYHALEANFDPGLGGPDTSAGKSGPPNPEPANPESRHPSLTRTTKSGSGGSGKRTGRSARQRKV